MKDYKYIELVKNGTYEYGKILEYRHNDTNVSKGFNKYDSIFDLLLDCNMTILDKIRSKQ